MFLLTQFSFTDFIFKSISVIGFHFLFNSRSFINLAIANKAINFAIEILSSSLCIFTTPYSDLFNSPIL